METFPSPWPYSVLDYGVGVLSIIVLGAVVYLFMKFLTTQFVKFTNILENLVNMTRLMADEFHRMIDEVHRGHEHEE